VTATAVQPGARLDTRRVAGYLFGGADCHTRYYHAKWARDPLLRGERSFGVYVPNNDGYQHCVNIYERELAQQYGVQMASRYNYTLDVSNRLADAGIAPTIISVGNEIRGGLLFPTGRYDQPYNIARLLHSGSAGIKDSRLNPKPKIMFHLDNGWDWSLQEWFYSTVLSQGPLTTGDFDMIGVSFYPFYGNQATLSNLRNSLTNLSNRWGKELVVAETNWPTSCPSPQYPFPGDVSSIPFSASGQTTYVQRVAEVVASVNRGVGLFYWGK
jgi:arabinogalactan endo-1,4-beta-galactosidase